MIFPLPGPTATVVTSGLQSPVKQAAMKINGVDGPQLRVDRPCHLIAVLAIGVNDAQMTVGLNEAWRYQVSRGIDDCVLRPRDDLFFNFRNFPVFHGNIVFFLIDASMEIRVPF